jgi:hypothetical protein
MPGKVQIKLGDMFLGACDLIILPCSTNGTVTQFVFNRLKNYNIPKPRMGIALGNIQLLPFKGAENIAQYVAFAASVDNNTSKLSAIESIAEKVGQLTIKNPSIQIIHIPLLGTGAGGLQSEKVIESIKKGFSSNSSPESVLIIHVLDTDGFKYITNYFNGVNRFDAKLPSKKKPKKTLRVFISYTKTNEDHNLWVDNFAKFLRENGINSRIDMWHLKTGMDLPQFMTNELALADKVIIISNEHYAAKADGRTGGVGWETMIIQGDMSKLPPDSTKYLTIVKSEDLEAGLPMYLKTKYVIHWNSQTKDSVNRQRILTELLNIHIEPPIGVPPVFI